MSKEEKRIFKIEVGEIPEEKVQEYIEEVKKQFKKPLQWYGTS